MREEELGGRRRKRENKDCFFCRILKRKNSVNFIMCIREIIFKFIFKFERKSISDFIIFFFFLDVD